MRATGLCFVVSIALAFQAGCDKEKNGEKSATPTGVSQTPKTKPPTKAKPVAAPVPDNIERPDFPGTEAGAKNLLTSFLKPETDHAALTKSLQPTSADYAAIFVGESAKKAEAGYAAMWSGGGMAISGKPEQTELKVWKATSEELQSGTGDSGKFPGGYKKIAAQLKPGLTFYRFKFVKPGETLGMAYDGLVHVNGHWVIVPKPWRSLR